MKAPDVLRAEFERVCGEIGSLYAFEKGPYALSHEGDEWAIATNGHILLAARRGLIAGDLTTCPERIATVAARWLRAPPETFTAVSAAKLKLFAGTPRDMNCEVCSNERELKCDECDGEGVHECECMDCGDVHDRDCTRCKGSGYVRCSECRGLPENSPGWFLGQIVDRWKLARILTAMDVSDAEQLRVASEAMSTAKVPSGYVIRPDSEPCDWTALLMGMANITTDVKFDNPETWKREAVAAS